MTSTPLYEWNVWSMVGVLGRCGEERRGIYGDMEVACCRWEQSVEYREWTFNGNEIAIED